MGKNFEADQLANITVKETGKLQNVNMHIIIIIISLLLLYHYYHYYYIIIIIII